MYITSFLMLLLPPLLYGLIIYLTSPYKSISIISSLKYIFAGISSVFLLIILKLSEQY